MGGRKLFVYYLFSISKFKIDISIVFFLFKQAGPSQVEAFENEKGRMHSLRLFCSFSIFLMNSVMVVVHQNGASK